MARSFLTRLPARFALAVFFFSKATPHLGAESGEQIRAEEDRVPLVATFSIVARDPETGELGIAVASKIPAVGAVVPYAISEVGAVATQASANPHYGPGALALLKEGKSPGEVIELLTEADPGRERRQLGIVAADGTSATFTGEKCLPWAGGIAGENFVVQGNILASEEVVKAIAATFESTGGELADRLLSALAAGQEKGGDRRGRQSAALLIVRKGWGYAGANDRYRDLRVDDHTDPIAELAKVYREHKKVFPSRRIPDLEKLE